MGKNLCLHLFGIRDANYLQASRQNRDALSVIVMFSFFIVHSSFSIFNCSFFIVHSPSRSYGEDEVVPFAGAAFLSEHFLVEATADGADGAHVATEHGGDVRWGYA